MNSLIGLIRDHPYLFFIIIMFAIYTFHNLVRTIILINKKCSCDCDECGYHDE